MRNLEVVNGQLDWYEDELEELEEFVAKRNGKILWGYILIMVKEEGKKVIDTLPWISKQGFMFTPFKDI